MNTRSRPRQLARNLALVARTALQHAGDDPLLLLVQTARRVPHNVRGILAAALGLRARGTRAALAQFVADRPEHTAAELRRAQPRTTAGRQLVAELAVQVGRPDVLPDGLEHAGGLTRARAAWNVGNITGAINVARTAGRAGRTYVTRLASERSSMRPGFELEVPSLQFPRSKSTGVRALHVLTNSAPHTASGYAFRSHHVLKSQAQAGIAVAACTRIGYPVTVGRVAARDVDVVDGVPYHRLLEPTMAPLPTERLQQMVRLMLPVVERFQPTVLHTTTNYTNALVTQALAKATGLPWVYEVRGQLEKTWLASRHPSVQDEAQASERYQLLRDKETEVILNADHVVAISGTLRADLVERGRPANEVTVIPNGVDEVLLEQNLTPAEARQRLGLPSDGFWVGSVSSLVDYEGFDTLIDAVAILRSEGLDLRAALVGDGVSRPGLLAQIDRLSLQPWIHLPGRVPQSHTPLWHQALNAFVVPRHDLPVTRIVTPLKPIEAMALGRPVIASDLPALSEIVSAPCSGVLVTPSDARELANEIAALHSDQARSAGYGVAGRAFARTRTWRAHGLTYANVYEEVRQPA